MNKEDSFSNDHSQALIDRLSENLKPVRVKSLRFLSVQYFLTLSILGLAFFGALGLIFGPWVGASRNEALVSILVFALNIATGSFLLAQFSRPGITISRKAPILFFSLLGIAILLEIVRFVMQIESSAWGPPIRDSWHCSIIALVIGAIAGTFLTVELRQESPVKLKPAALFLLLSGGTIATLILQIHCPNGNPIHQILWHFILPLGGFALSAKAFSWRALRW